MNEKQARANDPFDRLIVQYDANVQNIARALRALVQDRVPHATERIYGGHRSGMILYSIEKETNIVCGIQPGLHLCLFYIRHVRQDDTIGLDTRGRGVSNCYMAFTRPADIRADEIRSLLQIAAGRAQELAGAASKASDTGTLE